MPRFIWKEEKRERGEMIPHMEGGEEDGDGEMLKTNGRDRDDGNGIGSFILTFNL